MKLGDLVERFAALDASACAAWKEAALKQVTRWIPDEPSPLPARLSEAARLRRPGIGGSVSGPSGPRMGYDEYGRLVAREHDERWEYIRWYGDEALAAFWVRRRIDDTIAVVRLTWYAFEAGKLVESVGVRKDDPRDEAVSSTRDRFGYEEDRIVRIDGSEGDHEKWFPHAVLDEISYDAGGAVKQVRTTYGDQSPWISYKAERKATAKPAHAARTPKAKAKKAARAAPTAADIARAAKALASAAVKCARAFAKHRKGKIHAVALAYSVEGADVPLLGVLLVEPTDRDALNPAEWDGFDDDEELELETPAHVGATLGGLDHLARRELFVAATIEMRRVLGALCFATDYECSELDANLAAANPVAGESSLGADSRWPRVPRRGGG